MQSLDQLNAGFTCAGAIAFEVSPLGGIVVRLAHGAHASTVALQGAQVLSWQHGPREMLWLSPAARLGTGKAVRGGIPVCWPWFGAHPVDASKPAHGFVRTRAWQVLRAETDADATRLTLGTSTTAADHALWPHQADAEMTVSLGASLTLSLETHNTGGASFELTQALHTYFRVGDVGEASVHGLEGRVYIDKLDDGARKEQTGAIIFDREIDRIYLGDTGAITLADGRARRVEITSRGSASAVVWNPWLEKTARLGDMGAANAFRRMLCIETANAGDDVITLAPGARHVLGVTCSAP